MSEKVHAGCFGITMSLARAESLEPRRLLAADIDVDTEEHTLFAVGTEGADSISVRRVGIDDVFVRVNDLTGTFDMDDFFELKLSGLEGDDTVTVFGAYPDHYVVLNGSSGNNTLRGGAGPEEFQGSDGNDLIRGGGGIDSIHGGGGNDLLYGDDGDDEIYGEEGNDTIFAGNGNDNAFGGEGANVVRGEAGNDTLGGGELADAIFGGDGDDLVFAKSGNDYIEGNGGNDWLGGGWGNDTILGGTGDDYLDGEGGTDSLVGGSGKTVYLGGELGFAPPTVPVAFVGFANRLVVVGTSGADTITLRRVGFDDLQVNVNGTLFTFDVDNFRGGRYVFGDANNDRVTVLDNFAFGVTIDGGLGNDTLVGGPAVDQLFGDSGNDQLFGNGGGDEIVGGFGRDLLHGGDGDGDFLQAFGDNVIDTLIGGAGIDQGTVDAMDVYSEVETVQNPAA